LFGKYGNHCFYSSSDPQIISEFEAERRRSQTRLLALVNESWCKTFEEDENNSGMIDSGQDGFEYLHLQKSFASSCFRRGTSFAYVGFADQEYGVDFVFDIFVSLSTSKYLTV
jgi:hypothetical protein